MFESLNKVINGYGLISGFAIIGVTMAVSYWLSARLTAAPARLGDRDLPRPGAVLRRRRRHRRAERIGGRAPDVRYRPAWVAPCCCDFAIRRPTAFGVNVEELRRAGVSGVVSLFLGVGSSFVAGVAVAMAFGYTDAVSLTTIAPARSPTSSDR